MVKDYLSLIKFSHSIFAMPFAFVGFFLAIHSTNILFSFSKLIPVLLCMLFARSAAMAFNRWTDRDIDSLNPRTKQRELPAGILSSHSVLIFTIISCVAFVVTSYFINSLCFVLSPVALIIVLGYSYTKRFTFLCHFILGVGLALAPIGAYLAVTGKFEVLPLLYSCAVLFWVAGFDIIYSLQDEEFDRSNALKSLPSALGVKHALRLSIFLHILSAAIMVVASLLVRQTYLSMQFFHFVGLAIFIFMLFYQHRLIKSNDLSKINMVFFTTNGLASLIFGLFFILDFYI